MTSARKIFGSVIAVVLLAAVLVALPVRGGPGAQAADLSKFNPEQIISDADFYNPGTMNADQIQQFLQSKVSTCTPGNDCLINLRINTFDRGADQMCSAYKGASNESAATILMKVSQACGLNPQALIVMLEKEQGLVTAKAPGKYGNYRWNAAMGYACPDTAACDTRYYGFYNQVYMAAWQLKRYGNPPGTSQFFTWFPVGKPSAVMWNPNAACGSKTITIRNKATAALYYYTPYQPNPAAIAAGYGTGDACSSYGNRNFYQYYTDWFGGPVKNSNPIGSFESVQGSPGQVRVTGWALDPDTANPIQVHVYVDNASTAYTADRDRPDVGAAYPGFGSKHGFDVTVPVSPGGSHKICVYAINVGAGDNTLLGCGDVVLPSGSPVGGIDKVTAESGKVTVTGWALDPDTAAPITVHVYVGSASYAVTADQDTKSVPASYSAYGTKHGFTYSVAAPPGDTNVCIWGINVGLGGNTEMDCQKTTIPGSTGPTEQGRAPIGNFEKVVVAPGQVTASGWALDPDTAQPIQVHMYVGARSAAYTADGVRNDVANAYPAYGNKHGFQTTMTGVAGTQNVCMYAINTGPGGHTQLGCMTVNIPAKIVDQGRVPIGWLDATPVAPGKVTVNGWAIDPDTSEPIQVHVYVGGRSVAVRADKARPDVAALYPDYGPNHGFTVDVTGVSGTQNVCIYGINTGPGGNALLGCRTVTIPSAIVDQGRPPFGWFDSVSVSGTTISARGWAIDPDTNDPIAVHMYVNEASTAFRADTSRPDVSTVYPAFGPNHGFETQMQGRPGVNNVCMYAINNGAGGNTLLGCKSVTVN